MQALSLAWGILSLLGFLVGLVPCLGSLNWLNIPFSVAGLIFSIIAFAKGAPGNRTPSVVGIVLCLIAVFIGAKRLVLGGGIF
jgi:hypothetical protein